VINAVGFATSFFGKGQFVPDACVEVGSQYVFRQSLSAPYYQPLVPPQKVDYRNWGSKFGANESTARAFRLTTIRNIRIVNNG
jgi:hypothetical protein